MNVSASVCLVIITCLISYRAFKNPNLSYQLSHWPSREQQSGEYYRMLTSAFVHGNWVHLLVNMFVLWHFGEIVEHYFKIFFGSIKGTVLFVFTYFSTVILACVGTYLKKRDQEQYSSIGASGGVSGIVFIFILFYPWELLYLYGVIPIPGIVAGVLYLWYSSYASKNSNDQIDHDAHFYGAVVGVVLMVLLKPSVLSGFISKLVTEFPF